MTDIENIKIMNAAVKPIIDLLDKRLKNKSIALTALNLNSIDPVPDEVKKIREFQAIRLNAVIEELTDLIDISKAITPNA